LPLAIREVGDEGLERQLEALIVTGLVEKPENESGFSTRLAS
jgi:hypothetical protein